MSVNYNRSGYSGNSLPKKLIIGTRGSALALWQARAVVSEIAKTGLDIACEIKVIRTSGDWRPEHGEVALSADQGGKALFAKEIEDALLCGQVDLAVHSMKDMETHLPEGLVIPYMLPRADVRDAFVSERYRSLADMPKGARVGTTSARRAAFIGYKWPSLSVVPLRGNVHTRIDKVAAGQADATFLACAGLDRLEMGGVIQSRLSIEDMLPAAGQGAIGIEIRQDERDKMSFFGQFCCAQTYLEVSVERAVLRGLRGSCHTPVGAYACVDAHGLRLRVEVFAPDGARRWFIDERLKGRDLAEAQVFGFEIGQNLRADIPEGVF